MQTFLSGIRRVTAAVSPVRPADVQGNVESMIAFATGEASGSDLVVFPELCTTGATCGDLFLQKRLLDETDAWIAEFLDATRDLRPVFVFGAPFRSGGRLYDVAYVAHAGRVLGIVPRRSLPGRLQRWFLPAASETTRVAAQGVEVPFGPDLVFADEADPEFSFAVAFDPDAWDAPDAPLLCLPAAVPSFADASASPADESLALSRRARCACVLANAGSGESTTSAVYAGDTAIAFDGEDIARGPRHAATGASVSAHLDLGALEYRRRRCGFARTAAPGATMVPFRIGPLDVSDLEEGARVDPHPFLPDDPARRDALCAEIFDIQSNALATRLRNTGLANVVLGLSGGLDSTLALLVCHRAFQICGLPSSGIHLVTMPGFGTGSRTRTNANALAEGLGLALEDIPIVDACADHLAAIGHDGTTPDATYENAQARERTQILLDRANMVGGLVVGTGDLSELALGWCTFGGDQLSQYAVNAGIPKTLVRAVVAWYAEQAEDESVADALRAVVETPISPELLPAADDGGFAQKTEDLVGPYELHDFFLYHFLRNGAEPDKMRVLARCAFAGTYSPETVDRWLAVFLKRFFSQQFKRIASCEGPVVLAAAGLDPRDGWSMPGDVRASAWVD